MDSGRCRVARKESEVTGAKRVQFQGKYVGPSNTKKDEPCPNVVVTVSLLQLLCTGSTRGYATRDSRNFPDLPKICRDRCTRIARLNLCEKCCLQKMHLYTFGIIWIL